MIRRMHGLIVFLAMFAVVLTLCSSAVAQRPPGDTVGTARADTAAITRSDTVPTTLLDPAAVAAADSGPSAGGAFLRSLVIPGWGQAAFGDYVRGGVYFAGQAGNLFMLIKTISHLDAANEIERRRVAVVRDSLLILASSDSTLAARFDDPAELAAAIAQDSLVVDIRELVAAREQQREDWIAWTIFWTLANAIDAYVTAQFTDFPGDIFAQRRRGGGLWIGSRVPAGGVP